MKNLRGVTELPTGNREFAPPDSGVEGTSFERGALVVVTIVTALIAFSFASAMCSIALAPQAN